MNSLSNFLEKYGQYITLAGIILVILSALSILFDHKGFALRLINFAFLFLLVGFFLSLVRLKK